MTIQSVKEPAFAILLLGMTAIAFSLWHDAIAGIVAGRFRSAAEFIPPIAALIGASACFGLSALLLTSPWIRILSLSSAAVIPFLFLPAINGILMILAGSIILLLFAAHRIKQEYHLSLGFSTSKIMRAGLPLYFTLVTLALSLFYFIQVGAKDSLPSLLQKPLFDAAVRVLVHATDVIPEGDTPRPEMSVDEFLTLRVRRELEHVDANKDGIQEEEIARLVALQRAQIAERYRVSMRGDETLSEVLRTTVIERTEDLLGPYRIYIPYAAAVAFFFAFKTLTLILSLFTFATIFLLIKLLTRATIIASEKQVIEVVKLKL